MIAIDTNLLVYSYRADAEHHRLAKEAMIDLASSGRSWAIPWPCVHEFIGVVTRPRYYNPPSPIDHAMRAIRRWCESPGIHFLHETSDHFDRLEQLAIRANAIGALIHDVRIAAICLAHGVTELWSADRDFSRFPELKVVNPLSR